MKRLISILLIYSSFPAVGQDVHFSQFSKSSFFLNPSLTSFQQNDYKATLQRRSQWESVAEPFNTFSISAERKELFPSHSIGIQFINDIAGDAKFKTTGFNFSYSKLFEITKINLLSIAVGVGAFQRSLSFDELIFSQTEIHENINFWFPEVNLGLSNQYRLNKKISVVNGVSLFHLNKPKQSLTGDNNVRLNHKVNFHSSLYHSTNQALLFSPKIFYSIQDKEKEFIFAFDTEYLLSGVKNVILKSGLSYRWKDAIIYNFGAAIDSFDWLISYDINTSSLSEATNNKGGFEFSLVYVWEIKQKEKIVHPKQCPKYL
ncbi:PorP/SprF family type IX secretion system membrane protein [Flavobacteriales bacterium]|nr:PorP/SprF family type IX secretion system membrane protein [Flavobacteriales bacterium]